MIADIEYIIYRIQKKSQSTASFLRTENQLNISFLIKQSSLYLTLIEMQFSLKEIWSTSFVMCR